MAIPIPQRASGFTIGDLSADVRIDVFFDIQCPHSKTFWPTLLGLLDHYKSKPVKVTAHLITVSNHHQAWVMSLALMAVAQKDAKTFFDFATYLFDQQSRFTNAEFRHKTHEDQRQLAAALASDHSGIEPADLLELLDNHDIYIQTRTPIRYAATRSVWATPTIFVNNADDIALGFRSPLSDWLDLIDPLLTSES
jgi:protein-disulfide isomerase